MARPERLVIALSSLLAFSCGADDDVEETPSTATAESSDSGGTSAEEQSESTGPSEDLDMSEADFTCLLEWDQVRRFRIANLLGHLPEALAVAESPTGGTYPVGTVIQLIPSEAMVKRKAGYSPQSGDWEFFSLRVSASGTEILERGTTDVVNQFNGNCFDCHAQAEPQWDFVCEQDRGCVPLPIDESTIETLQQNDPRCP